MHGGRPRRQQHRHGSHTCRFGSVAQRQIDDHRNTNLPRAQKAAASRACHAPRACYAVGRYVNSTGTEVTLAEHWPLLEMVDPGIAQSDRREKQQTRSVSRARPKSCEAVGHYVNSSGLEVTLAEGTERQNVVGRGIAKSHRGQKQRSCRGLVHRELKRAPRREATSTAQARKPLSPSAGGARKNGRFRKPRRRNCPAGVMEGFLHHKRSVHFGRALPEQQRRRSDACRALEREGMGAPGNAQPDRRERQRFERCSCASSTSCIAVGRYLNSSGAEVVFAESWNGTTWSLTEPVTPTGAKSSKLVGVSCTSTTACIAVGAYVNSGGTQVAFGESWNGTAWTLKEMSIRRARKAPACGVSCASSTSCIATGRYVNSGGAEVTLAESWSGTAWSLTEPLNPTGAKQQLDRCLVHVEHCVHRGWAHVNSGGKKGALAESWNGTAWSLKEPVVPTGATLEHPDRRIVHFEHELYRRRGLFQQQRR